jgi:hypothetical protein
MVYSFKFYGCYNDFFGFWVGVASHKGVFTLPKHLIPPLENLEICLCPPIYFSDLKWGFVVEW